MDLYNSKSLCAKFKIREILMETPWVFNRKKKRVYVSSIIYRCGKLLPLSSRCKFILFSNLAWIFRRMAFENSHLLHNNLSYVVVTKKLKFIQNGLNANDVVLDLGCADGWIANFIAKFSKHCVGVDHNLRLISEAQKKYQLENLAFICDDAVNYLSKSNNRFDALILSHILEHLDNPTDFLKQFQRYFDKFYIEVPDNDQDEHSYLRVACGFEPLYNDADHIWEFGRSNVFKIFSDLKFEVISSEFTHGVMRFWVKTSKNI